MTYDNGKKHMLKNLWSIDMTTWYDSLPKIMKMSILMIVIRKLYVNSKVAISRSFI